MGHKTVLRRRAPLDRALTAGRRLLRPGATRKAAQELRRRLEPFGTWMYRFDLGEGVATPLHQEWLMEVHETRSRMIFPELDRRFGNRWREVRCLDAGCNEGYFGFLVADRGAQSVLGVDARESNIQKAEFVKERLGFGNISFRIDDVMTLGPERDGTFHLTLALGLLYHLEDPMRALRSLRAVTEELCVIDTQVLRAGPGVTTACGTKDQVVETEDVLGVIEEPEWEWNPLASVTGVSLVPNKPALMTMLRHAGFAEVRQIMPYQNCYEQYASFDRIVVFASV